jgi:GNAT superfamily N-acetyltransferase
MSDAIDGGGGERANDGTVIVRAATRADYEPIRDLLHESDAWHASELPAVCRTPPQPRFTLDEYAEVIGNERCLLAVAEHSAEVLGFVEATECAPASPDEIDSPWCTVHNLFISAKWRRRGIGRRLMAFVDEWTRRRGLTQTRLNVFAFNRAAAAFYERIGYRTIAFEMLKARSKEEDDCRRDHERH